MVLTSCADLGPASAQ